MYNYLLLFTDNYIAFELGFNNIDIILYNILDDITSTYCHKNNTILPIRRY